MYSDIVEENRQLNEEEYQTKQIHLKSYPQALFIQIDALCNQNCVFCSRPKGYEYFDLDDWRRKFEEKLMPAIIKAKRLNLTGSGELLMLPEAKKNLVYFNQFKHAEKMFATNGSSLTPKMIDFIAESENRYVIHISLHASQGDYHSIMTNSSNYPVIQHNVGYLAELKRSSRNGKIKVNFVFLATTLNIDNLPYFIKFAHEFQADRVIVYYNYIYELTQKKISCYFIQEKVNEIFDNARDIAKYLNVELELPPKFRQNDYPQANLCKEAWSQIMLNSQGSIIPCDVSGDSYESINGKSFMEVWNGRYYTNLRSELINGQNACSNYCIRANPSSVNKFRPHLITRGKTEEEIEEFLKLT